VLLDTVPIFNALPTAGSACVLGIIKWIATLSGLATVKVRISVSEGLTNSPFGCHLQPVHSLPASVVHGPNIQLLMPKVVSNQFIFHRSKRVFDIRQVALVDPWPINEVSSAVSATAANDMSLPPFLCLAEAV
jgi:hypothetical protein